MECSDDFDPAWLANPAMRDEALFQRLLATPGDPKLDQEDETFLRWVSAWSEPTVNRLCELIEQACRRRLELVALADREPEPPERVPAS
jgi:hypothetical protein